MTRMITKCDFCSNQSNNFDIFQTFQLSLPVSGVELNKTFTLEECMDMLKKIDLEEKKNKIITNKIYFDPASNKLKKAEYERSQKSNLKFEDDVEAINRKHKNSFIRTFFKSKV